MAGENIDTGAEVIVKYGDKTASGKNNTFLLLSTATYSVTAKPGPDYSAGWREQALSNHPAVNDVEYLDLISKDITITVPHFADIYVCVANERQSKPTTEIEPSKVGTPDYASGTRTDCYNLTNGTVYEYRVSVPSSNVNCDEYVTYVGMFKKNDNTAISVTAAQLEDGANA